MFAIFLSLCYSQCSTRPSDLSVYLAEYLLKDCRNIELIKQVLGKKYKAHDPHDEIEALIVGSYVEVLEKRAL